MTVVSTAFKDDRNFSRMCHDAMAAVSNKHDDHSRLFATAYYMEVLCRLREPAYHNMYKLSDEYRKNMTASIENSLVIIMIQKLGVEAPVS